MAVNRARRFATVVLLAILAAGCIEPPPEQPSGTLNDSSSSASQSSSGDTAAQPSSGDAPAPADAGTKKAFALGDLIEPFAPPPRESLDKVEWIDQPVLDSLVLLRERQKDEKPLATAEEALKLRNKTPEDNRKILSALGRLPENDGAVDWNARIDRYSPMDVSTLNPVLVSSVADMDISSLTTFGLFSYDWNFRPFASKETVASWQTSKDHLMDKVVLRDDLTWSDGKPITAHDVVFSYKVIMTEAVPVPAMRSGTDKIKWIEAYDDHTLVYFHKEALATNIWNVNFAVLPKHIYEKSIAADPTLENSPAHVKLENNPVVGGAYEIAERTRGKQIVLRARESWYMHGGKQVRDRPYFREVRFNVYNDPTVALLALKKGEIEEMMFANPELWNTQTVGDDFYAKNTKAYGVEWTTFHFGWNMDGKKVPFFTDRRVRQAMSYTVDYKELLDRLLYGLFEPATGIYHAEAPWFPKDDPPKPYKQDLDKAEALLDEAGWSDHDGDGIRDRQIDGRSVPFEFSILCNNDKLRIDTCNLLKENLDRIGIICNVRPLEATVLFEKTQNKEFQAYFGGWGTGADPDTAENIWGTGQGRNYISYSNPEVDRLYDAGRREFDRDKRAVIYGRIHKILYDDQPYTWLYTRNAFYGFNKNLRGYNFSPRGPYSYGPGFGSIWKPAQAQP